MRNKKMNQITNFLYAIERQANRPIPRFKRWVRHKYQKLTRGFSDEVTWSLDWEIAKFILPRLKLFKKLNNGFPPDLTPEKWDGILDEMIHTFELIENGAWEISDEEEQKELERGLDLFRKHFFDLWW